MHTTKNDIITTIYLSENFNVLINKMHPAHLRDDLRSEVMMVLLNKPDAFIQDLHNRGMMQRYTNRLVVLMMIRKDGYFCKTFRSVFNGGELKSMDDDMPSKINIDSFEVDATGEPIRLDERIPYVPLNGRVYKEQVEEKALAAINELPWYEKEVVKLYLQKGSYRLVAEATKIPHCSIGGTINSAIKKIRQRVGGLPDEHE